MIKKKFFLKDIEHEKEDGTYTIEGFTDDSYVIIDIPSMREKISLHAQMRGKEKGEIEDFSIEATLKMITDVKAETIEGDLIADVDHLSVYPIDVLIGFLGNLLRTGYVPKKSKNV